MNFVLLSIASALGFLLVVLAMAFAAVFNPVGFVAVAFLLMFSVILTEEEEEDRKPGEREGRSERGNDAGNRGKKED